MFFILPLYDDNPTNRTPVVTCVLIALCAAVFLWQLGQDEATVAYRYGLIPAAVFGSAKLASGLAAVPPWATVFTSMFVHSGWLHIGGNMLFLWIFGNNIEDVLGHFRYAALYLLSGIAAALCQGLSDPASTVPMVGASGAIAGVLGAYLLLYPYANVHVFVWIFVIVRMIAVPAWIMLGLWFAIQLLSGLGSDGGPGGVAFWAHVGGFVAGVALLTLMRPRGTELWRPPHGPGFVIAAPRDFPGRRTFRGSVPDSGASRYRPPGPGPWGR